MNSFYARVLSRLELSRVPISKARPYLKNWNKDRYSDIFGAHGSGSNKHRIYVPIDGESAGKVQKALTPPKQVED